MGPGSCLCASERIPCHDGVVSDRDPVVVEFEPRPVGGRRRRLDPLAVAALAVAVGIALAVVKPWTSPGTGERADASPAIANEGIGAPGSEAPVASASAAEEAPASAILPITWSLAASALEGHEAWGVRAIIRDPRQRSGRPDVEPPSRFVERWGASRRNRQGVEQARLGTADQGVLALGLTFPADELPLDVRIWRATDAGWTWLDAPALGGSPGRGGFLFAPPLSGGVPVPSWPSGSYRFEILTGATVRMIHLDLPSRFEIVPRLPPANSEAATAPDSASPFAPDFGSVRGEGAFVVQDGLVVPPAGAPATDGDVVEAWLGPAPAIHAPRANGLGVLLPPGTTDATAVLRRLAPDTDLGGVRRAVGLRSARERQTPYVIFRAPDGQAWPPGVYRIDAEWTDATGPRTRSYALELRPGPVQAYPDLLRAVRAFRADAGTDAVVGLTADQEPHDLSCAANDPAGPTSATTDPMIAPRVIGLGHAVGAVPSRIRLERLSDGPGSADQPILVARGATPGLSLVVPKHAEAFPPGAYRLTVGEGGAARSVAICAGAAKPG